MPDLLYISYLLIMQLDSWITEVLKWVRFAKKAFFSSSPPPCKLNKVSFPNALRPDSPSRKFREQQNYSENSESTEETESAEETEAPVSEPASDRHSCLSPRGQAQPPTLEHRPTGLYSRRQAGMLLYLPVAT